LAAKGIAFPFEKKCSHLQKIGFDFEHFADCDSIEKPYPVHSEFFNQKETDFDIIAKVSC
jgi:hypothetical protein